MAAPLGTTTDERPIEQHRGESVDLGMPLPRGLEGMPRLGGDAKLTKKDIARIDEQLNFKGRIEREGWVAQAKTLAKK